MCASLRIVKPRAIVPENLAPGRVTHVFNLEKFIQRMGKVRVDVRVVEMTMLSSPMRSITSLTRYSSGSTEIKHCLRK